MGVPIRYNIPYQIDAIAKDLTSGRRTGTTHYLRNNQFTGSPPAFGQAIPGSDTATLLASFKTNFENVFPTLMSLKWSMQTYTMRAIVGYGYTTPFVPISGATFGGVTAQFLTPFPHNLVNNGMVSISGIGTPTGVNGTYQVTVLSSTVFQVNTTVTGFYGGGGSVQRVSGGLGLQYRDNEFLTSSAVGLVTGDAMPLFVDVDVQRINPGTGKSWRSRFAMSPIGESDCINGGLTSTAITAWSTQLAALNINMSNGGSDATGGESSFRAFSKLQASLVPSPFSSSATFLNVVSSFHAHSALGSQNNRKPRLTGT